MSHFEFLRQNFGLCQLPQFTVLVDWKKNEKFWVIFKHCALLCLLFDIIYASLTFILTIRKICRNWERRSSFFPPFFGDGSSIVEWYRRSYRKCLCFLCCRHKSGLPPSFLKSTLLFLTFLMRKHTVFKSFFCLKINFSNDSLRNCLFKWN